MARILQLNSRLSGESGQSTRLASESACALAAALERIDELAA